MKRSREHPPIRNFRISHFSICCFHLQVDGAVVCAKVAASNGNIYPMDTVLVPPFLLPAKVQPLTDILAFKGWAPEVVNGRLAMLGWVYALGGEFSAHQSFLAQLGGHFGDFAFAAGLWTFASLAPALNSSMGYTANPTTMAGSKEWQTIMQEKPKPITSREEMFLEGGTARYGDDLRERESR